MRASFRPLPLLSLVAAGATWLALAPGLALPGTATAGEFGFAQCGGSASGFDGRYSRLEGVDRVNVLTGCHPTGQGRAGVYQDRRGGQFAEAEGGQFVWRVPPGLSVSGVTVRAKLKDANGLRAAIAGRTDGTEVDLDAGLAHDGSVVEARWSTRPLDSVLLRLRCNRPSGCPNRPDSGKAFFEVLSIEFRVADTRPPSLDGSGELFATASDGRWLGGIVDYALTGSDIGSGLSGFTLRVNGYPVPVVPASCAGVTGGRAIGFLPCPPAAERTARLDTTVAPFQEGANRIEACVSDYADHGLQPNTTCAAPATVRVDNRQPPPPVDMRTDMDGAWSPTPEVAVRWDSTGDAGSGITSVRWSLLRADRGRPVSSGSIAGSARSTTIRVPEPGDYLLETRFADQAGNVGSPAVARVRFDDIPPPPARPLVPSGWQSADELPIRAAVEPVEAAGPSGILGYALATSDQGAVVPCRATTCDSDELTLVDRPGVAPPTVGGLREGVNWISAVAVSGALLPSRSPVTARLLVDRTYPETSLLGVPSGWSREPVRLVARSADALSGMEDDPDDDGRPVTVIEVEGGETVEADGDRAEVEVAREGITEVRFFARDLAGNVNDGRLGPGSERHPRPGIEKIMVDRTPPSVTFAGRPDPTRPELVRFDVDDPLSGVGGGRLVIYPAGSPGHEVEVPSLLSAGAIEAGIPSDDLPAGPYELVARVSDRAGNFRESEPARLELPLKVPATVRLGDELSPRRKLSGSVLLGGGPPGRSIDLVVEEDFGSRSGRAPRLSDVRAAPDGSFDFTVPPGPRRTIRVRFAGTASESRAVSDPIEVIDRDRVSFSTSTRSLRNGRILKMRGRVTGPGVGTAGAGKDVVIQFFDPSRKRWRPVEVVSCGADGRFRLDYRFMTISSAQRILFRALSLGETDWPFRPAASRQVAVVVRP